MSSQVHPQGELEHRCLKRRFPRTGKKKTAMVTSIANQEAIERFIRRVNTVRESLATGGNHSRRPARQRSSPADHYHIAAASRNVQDLTEWLGELGDDPAIEVACITPFDFNH